MRTVRDMGLIYIIIIIADLSGLYHCHLGMHRTTPVLVNQLRRIQVEKSHDHRIMSPQQNKSHQVVCR